MPSSNAGVETMSAELPAMPLTLEGLSVLHQMFRFRWPEWRKLDASRQADIAREAAAVASQALDQHRCVWWAADAYGAAYYALPLQPSARAAAAFPVPAMPAGIARLPAPDVVLFSRPDVFDEHGALRTWLKAHGFVDRPGPPGFTIWQSAGEGPATIVPVRTRSRF